MGWPLFLLFLGRTPDTPNFAKQNFTIRRRLRCRRRQRQTVDKVPIGSKEASCGDFVYSLNKKTILSGWSSYLLFPRWGFEGSGYCVRNAKLFFRIARWTVFASTKQPEKYPHRCFFAFSVSARSGQNMERRNGPAGN